VEAAINDAETQEYFSVRCRYEAEVARGLVHTEEWHKGMESMKAEYEADCKRWTEENIKLYRAMVARGEIPA
jgi:L-amino acid N-acyltransferase YncA